MLFVFGPIKRMFHCCFKLTRKLTRHAPCDRWQFAPYRGAQDKRDKKVVLGGNKQQPRCGHSLIYIPDKNSSRKLHESNSCPVTTEGGEGAGSSLEFMFFGDNVCHLRHADEEEEEVEKLESLLPRSLAGRSNKPCPQPRHGFGGPIIAIWSSPKLESMVDHGVPLLILSDNQRTNKRVTFECLTN